MALLDQKAAFAYKNRQQDMNADNFTRYLEDPSLLYQISYQELKSLVLLYPYCQNLHLLLFQKSIMDGVKEWEQNLEKAAIYSIDRAHLFRQARKLDRKIKEADSFLLSGEFLELKSLDALIADESMEEERPAGPAVQEEASLTLEFSPLPKDRPGLKPEDALSRETEEEEDEDIDVESLFEAAAGIAPREERESIEESPLATKPVENALAESTVEGQAILHSESPGPLSAPFSVPPELIESYSSLLGILQLMESGRPAAVSPAEKKKAPSGAKERRRPPLLSPELPALAQKFYRHHHFPAGKPADNEEITTPGPQPKQSFTSWLEQFQHPTVQLRLSELMESKKREEFRKERKKRKKAMKGKSGVGHIAIRSITENKEVLSETLAELLAAQGEYHKAIEMYQRLMLVFPKKSDYFAEQIEILKSK